MKLLCYVLNGGCSASPPHEEGEALRVERVVREPVDLLALHFATAPTADSPDFRLEVDAPVPARQVADSTSPGVVVAPMPAATDTACRFFGRRLRRTTSAIRSPNTPRTAELGVNPGNLYASRNCRRLPDFPIRASSTIRLTSKLLPKGTCPCRPPGLRKVFPRRGRKLHAVE